MLAATRDLFFERTARRHEELALPGFGTVRLQSLTESERTALERRFLDKRGRLDPDKISDVKLYWVISTVVDEHGAKLFADGDIEKLREVDSCIVDGIYEAAMKHVGLTEADQAALLGN
jgi:hypothetical protein